MPRKLGPDYILCFWLGDIPPTVFRYCPLDYRVVAMNIVKVQGPLPIRTATRVMAPRARMAFYYTPKILAQRSLRSYYHSCWNGCRLDGRRSCRIGYMYGGVQHLSPNSSKCLPRRRIRHAHRCCQLGIPPLHNRPPPHLVHRTR